MLWWHSGLKTQIIMDKCSQVDLNQLRVMSPRDINIRLIEAIQSLETTIRKSQAFQGKTGTSRTNAKTYAKISPDPLDKAIPTQIKPHKVRFPSLCPSLQSSGQQLWAGFLFLDHDVLGTNQQRPSEYQWTGFLTKKGLKDVVPSWELSSNGFIVSKKKGNLVFRTSSQTWRSWERRELPCNWVEAGNTTKVSEFRANLPRLILLSKICFILLFCSFHFQ